LLVMILTRLRKTAVWVFWTSIRGKISCVITNKFPNRKISRKKLSIPTPIPFKKQMIQSPVPPANAQTTPAQLASEY
jgi:hypothetical protein